MNLDNCKTIDNKEGAGSKMAGKVYFVSGIDTGVGKTIAVGAMAKSLAASGRDVITMKMVQTGCRGFSEDIDEHRRLMGSKVFAEDESGLTAPQIFSFPSSPYLSARLEGKVVDTARIATAVAQCAGAHELVLVEGAGGLCVPLTEELLTADFVAREGWPLILVACGRLGAINHTLLSLEAASARGMRLAGIVYNDFFSEDPRLDEDALAAIARHSRRLGLAANIVRLARLAGVAQGPEPGATFAEIFA